MFDWSGVRLNSRMVDKVAKQLRCNRLDVADKIEGMISEVRANRAKILAYENLTRDSLTHLPDIRPSNYKV